nr:transporter substrate-binding domain-containing protein [Kordiimonas marina]
MPSAARAGDTLKVGITSGSPPYVFSVERGDGLDLEILHAIIERMGDTPDFVYVPFARRSLILTSHKVDAVTFWSLPKGVTCHPAKPYRFWRNALFTAHKKGVPGTGGDMRRTGIFMGSEHLKPALAKIGIDYDSLQRIYTVNAGVRMMLYGRLDSYIGDYPTVIYNFHKEDPTGEYEAKILHFFPPTPQQLCFTDAAKADAFNAALDALLKENPEVLNTITRNHGLKERITPPLSE